MEFSVALNYLRFVAMFFSVFFIGNPLGFVALSLISTVGYSLVITFIKPTSSGLIIHKCINHVPSTILLVFSCYYDRGLRPLLLFSVLIQYLNIWLQIYSEILTKELREQIISKAYLLFIDEAVWALSDVISKQLFIILNYLVDLNIIEKQGLIRSGYNFAFSGFLARRLMDLMTLVSSVLNIVDLEPKKDN